MRRINCILYNDHERLPLLTNTTQVHTVSTFKDPLKRTLTDMNSLMSIVRPLLLKQQLDCFRERCTNSSTAAHIRTPSVSGVLSSALACHATFSVTQGALGYPCRGSRGIALCFEHRSLSFSHVLTD